VSGALMVLLVWVALRVKSRKEPGFEKEILLLLLLGVFRMRNVISPTVIRHLSGTGYDEINIFNSFLFLFNNPLKYGISI